MSTHRPLAPLFVGIALLALAAIASACTASRDEYAALVQEANACEAGDTCVVVSTCGCEAAVNAAEEETLVETFSDVECCPPFAPCPVASCIAGDGAVCEEGNCVVRPAQL